MSQKINQTSNSNRKSFKVQNESQRAPSPTPTDQPSIVDPIWEILDPKPDIQDLFIKLRETIFEDILPKVEVKWSRRMMRTVGQCIHSLDENGDCDGCIIELSQPILELRPRRDTVETLLHEMIHAFLCYLNKRDEDPHGENFVKTMDLINKTHGTDITIEHSHFNEVEALKKHWWQCDGPCQKEVKRTRNRAPSSKERWFREHEQTCGGKFIKTSEPEVPARKKRRLQESPESKGPAQKKKKT